jgi:endo-1,3-1,4-beta-glycanase ExoK
MPVTSPRKRIRPELVGAVACLAFAMSALGATIAQAEDAKLGKSFVENFDRLDQSRWYVSDGWTNGDHQNCDWSKNQVRITDGVLSLGFEKKAGKDRDYQCGEIQTKQRYGYGTFEARMKAAAGSGLNSAFFTYIGPVHKQPHDEIDFEVLGRNPARVEINQYVNGKSMGDKTRAPVTGGADQDFHDYAFVWEKDRIRWYVDGKQVGEVTDPAKLPSHPALIYASLWGTDTLTDWMGVFADPGGQVRAEVDRIAYTALGEACQFPESVACGVQSQ